MNRSFEIRMRIDEGALGMHNGDAAPPPNDPDDWEASDIEKALALGFAKIVKAEALLEDDLL